MENEIVLVIDDEKSQLEIINFILKKIGISQVVTASSAMKALEILDERTDISTIILDILMPDMDGSQFLNRLAALNKTDVRIILISSLKIDALKSIANTGRAIGMNISGILQKPIHDDLLKLRLQRKKPLKKTDSSVVANEQNTDLSIQSLVQALSDDSIHPWYQPKVNMTDFTLVGVEALARWKQSDDSMVSPGVFVPAIESAGLADMLFFTMLESVLKDMQRWQKSGLEFQVSVNLSMDCAFSERLPGKLSVMLDTYQVDPAKLVLEVTESRIVSDNEVVTKILNQIAEMGVVLSIDDFGTGYSSLSQMALLPFGELKIDRSFVKQSGTSEKSDAILQGIITMGLSLGLNVVAEGVETHEQLDRLKLMGAMVVQGYLMAKPMACNNFEQWLSAWRPGSIGKPGCERPFSILIVDDARSIRSYLEASFLERSDSVTILMAENGEQALSIIKKEQVDAATLDFHMPGIDGIELLRSLRNIRATAKYALLTASTDEKVAYEATQLGALYCPKPLTDAQLNRIVQYFGMI